MNLVSLASRIRGASDLALPAAVLAIVALLFAPLPPALLDVGIALNLGISAVILLVTLFARDALRFASFPTLLLFTTLFRLALNVSSTRLVLARGDAGQVIDALGRVVVDGNTVVGVVVFAILATVQILVVAKGSERVAEVAARFTLDALPGKQMSIDADLRAGAIDQAAARARRRDLERESQLYGAMDGALKFVKGDALAGILIVVVNVAGGTIAGCLRGMPVGAAFGRYALLAIGDGLASQVPALLLAISAGVAVTRVSGEDGAASLGSDLARQLLAEPRALGAVAALLTALAAAPGLPPAPFLAAAAAAGAAASVAVRRRSAAPDHAPNAAVAPCSAGPAPTPPSGPVEIELADDLYRAVVARFGSDAAFGEVLAGLLWRDRGVLVAPPRIRSSPGGRGAWRVVVDDVPACDGFVDAGVVLALGSADELGLVDIAATPARDPDTGAPAALVALADATRARALAPLRGTADIVLAEVAAALRRSASELVGVDGCQRLLDALEPSAPALVREVARTVPAPVVAEVLRRLLEEQVSIRPLRLVLEALLEAGAPSPALGPSGALVERCRRALRRQIAHACRADGEHPLEAVLLDPLTESRLREGLSGEVLALAPATASQLISAFESCLAGASGRPAVLLTPSDIRRPLRQLVAGRFPDLKVLSYDELPPELQVRPVGRVALAA